METDASYVFNKNIMQKVNCLTINANSDISMSCWLGYLYNNKEMSKKLVIKNINKFEIFDTILQYIKKCTHVRLYIIGVWSFLKKFEKRLFFKNTLT